MESGFVLVTAEPDNEGRLWRDFFLHSMYWDETAAHHAYQDATVRLPAKAIMLVRCTSTHGLLHEASNVGYTDRTLCSCISNRTHLSYFYRALWEQGLAVMVESLIPDYASVFTIPNSLEIA